MKKLILSTILFLSFSKISYAVDTTNSYLPNVATNSGWVNADNVLTIDNYATSNLNPGNTSDTIYLDNFDIPDLPIGQTLVGINVFAKYLRSATGTTTRLDFYISDDHCSTFKPNGTNFDYYDSNWTYNVYQLNNFEWSKSVYEPDWITYYNNLNKDGLCLKVIASSGGGWTGMVRLDYAQVSLQYDFPESSADLSSYEASPSAGRVYLDLEGDTGVSSDDMVCEVEVYQDCTSNSFPALYSQVASINISDNGATQTTYLGGSSYEGYGWSDSDTTWQAENVSVPYNNGYDCYYDYHTVCTENGITYQDSYTEGDTIINQGNTLVEPEPDNPLQWVVWKIRSTLIELFVPNFGLVGELFSGLKTNLLAKAPFAYLYAVLSMDTSTVSEQNLTLTIFAGDLEYEYIETTLFDDIKDTIQTTIQFVLYTLFIVYLFALGRRLLK